VEKYQKTQNGSKKTIFSWNDRGGRESGTKRKKGKYIKEKTYV
jgi:hypothetical protein